MSNEIKVVTGTSTYNAVWKNICIWDTSRNSTYDYTRNNTRNLALDVTRNVTRDVTFEALKQALKHVK